MATIKAYLYCTNAKPYLTKVVELGRYYAVGKKDMKTLGYKTEGELKEASLNGTVCFECEIDKVEEIIGDIGPYGLIYSPLNVIVGNFEKEVCLTQEQMANYFETKAGIVGYALYLSNVKAIKPLTIMNPPQNMGKYSCYSKSCFGIGKDYPHALVISIRPEYLCKILNGEKTIEVRRVITKELKDLIK